MSSNDRVRVEIAFDGNQVLSVYVPSATADDLDRALAGDQESLSFEESRVGFGATG